MESIPHRSDCGTTDLMWADVCDLCLADLGEHPPPGRPGSDVVLPGVIEQIRFADLPALRALIDLAERRYAASR